MLKHCVGFVFCFFFFRTDTDRVNITKSNFHLPRTTIKKICNHIHWIFNELIIFNTDICCKMTCLKSVVTETKLKLT